MILAFEMLEAMRALPYLKKGGKMIANTQKMNPMPVITGAMEYPKNIEEKLSAKINLQAVDALSLGGKGRYNQGCKRSFNHGLLAKSMDVDKNVWIDVIKETVPEKFLDVNIKAFELGYEL